jgi:hypothetical protein
LFKIKNKKENLHIQYEVKELDDLQLNLIFQQQVSKIKKK